VFWLGRALSLARIAQGENMQWVPLSDDIYPLSDANGLWFSSIPTSTAFCSKLPVLLPAVYCCAGCMQVSCPVSICNCRLG
jgi:hypothetical protein